jgi:hypothetical protein
VRVPVTINGAPEPGDHAKTAVREISRKRTIVGLLLFWERSWER